jgi:hypothetical protein
LHTKDLIGYEEPGSECLEQADQQAWARGRNVVLKLDRTQRTLRRLETKPLKSANVLERSDLQRMIINTADPFFDEIGEKLLILGEEVVPTDVVDDRIDVLAMDKQGAIVVIELKRGAHKLHLLQALSYAAMTSDWDREGIISQRATFKQCSQADAQEEIEEFLEDDISTLNEQQRVLLIAEQYDYQVLATAKWLTEKHDAGIACWKMELAEDAGSEYLSFSCVYPPPELANAARIRSGGGEPRPTRWPNWEAALDAVKNPAVARFYRNQLAEHRPNRLSRRILLFNVDGKNRFRMSARTQHAYVWQHGRFAGDALFWRDRLGLDTRIDPVAEGRSLRIFLKTDAQFDAFLKSIRQEIPGRAFTHEPLVSDIDDSVDEETAQAV